MKLRKNSFKKIYNHRWCIHSFDGCFFNSRFLVYFFFFGKNNIKRLYKYSRKSL